MRAKYRIVSKPDRYYKYYLEQRFFLWVWEEIVGAHDIETLEKLAREEPIIIHKYYDRRGNAIK